VISVTHTVFRHASAVRSLFGAGLLFARNVRGNVFFKHATSGTASDYYEDSRGRIEELVLKIETGHSMRKVDSKG